MAEPSHRGNSTLMFSRAPSHFSGLASLDRRLAAATRVHKDGLLGDGGAPCALSSFLSLSPLTSSSGSHDDTMTRQRLGTHPLWLAIATTSIVSALVIQNPDNATVWE